MGLRLLQGLKMKKLLLFSLPALFACGTDTPTQAEDFAAHHVIIPRAAICENLDASVREQMDSGEYENLSTKIIFYFIGSDPSTKTFKALNGTDRVM